MYSVFFSFIQNVIQHSNSVDLIQSECKAVKPSVSSPSVSVQSFRVQWFRLSQLSQLKLKIDYSCTILINRGRGCPFQLERYAAVVIRS